MYRPSHRIVPDAPTGYALVTPQGRSRWGILQAVASTNLFLNPSVEVNLTGYGSFSGSETITRVTTQQRRGSYAIQVVTSASTNRGLVANNGGTGFLLTAGVTYTVSVDVFGVGGVPYLLYLSGPLSSQPGTLRFIGRGRWERQVLTFTPTQTGAHNINLLKENSASTAAWWIDGWQLEQLPYATTYFDGDTLGYEYDYVDLTTGAEKPKPYQWLGTPHASTSRRLGTTRSGGRRRSFDEFSLMVLGATGVGLPSMLISSARFANGGGRFQRAIPDVRTLLIAGVIFSSSAYGLQAQASQLTTLLDPRYGPATLVYQDHEDNEEAYVPVVTTAGLELDITNNYRLDLPLSFDVYGPMTRGYDASATLNYTQDVTNANYILQRRDDGIWQALGNGSLFSIVGFTRSTSNNYLYIGAASAPSAGALHVWNGSTLTLDVQNYLSPVTSVVSGPDGAVYIGLFSGNVYRYVPSTGVQTEIGAGAFGRVYSMTIGPDGTLYVGGGTVDNLLAIKKYSAGSWSTLASTSDPLATRRINGMAITGNQLFFGGAFTSLTGANTASVTNVGVIDVTTNLISTLETGANNTINAVALSKSGYVLFGGAATQIGTIFDRIAAWNGSSFVSVGNGLNFEVRTIDTSPATDTPWIGGSTTGSTPDNLYQLRNGAWTPTDVNLPGNANVLAVTTGPDNSVFVGFDTSGTAQSAVTTVNNTGSDVAYPTVTFTGPGQIHQLRNYTTNDAIYFSNLVLNSGEVATLTLSQGGVSFESNFRGSLLGYIGPGSNPASWNLAVGSNNVSSFMTSTTANSSILLKFRVPLGKL